VRFRVTMKDPDGVYESLQDAAEESIKAIEGLSEREREELTESRRVTLGEATERWFRYSEYLTVEIDTEADTCIVVPVTP
jgi:hypothetical protein